MIYCRSEEKWGRTMADVPRRHERLDYLMEKLFAACGIDVGNGYVKAKVQMGKKDAYELDFPSCIAYVPSSGWVPAEPNEGYVADLVNELDCDVMSDAVAPGDRKRIVIGRRASASGRIPIMFDINDSTPKCDDSLSGQFVCATIAASAVRSVFEDTGALPTSEVVVRAFCALALPISDFAKYREKYRTMFVNGQHTVHIHNFDREVSVRIEFADVYVLPEGAAAQYAIGRLPDEVLEGLIQAARDAGMDVEGESAGTLRSYRDTVGVDVGEGTVNFPVFRGGRVNIEASSSLNRGYGTVLTDVVEATRGLGYAPDSRKELSEFMLKDNPSPRDRKIQAKLQHVIDDTADVFARDVIAEYTRVLRRTKLTSDVVWVYGGGADAVREFLWPRLFEASKLDDDIFTPVMYLPSELSRTLNRDGLFAVALAKAREAEGGVKKPKK